MKKFSFVLILLLSLVLSQAIAQSQSKRIDQLIEKAMDQWNVPGMAVAVVKDGKVVLSRGYGTVEANRTLKVDNETLFAIASNTKGFLSSAIATLVTDGKLRWDDKVKEILPYFELYDPYVTNEVTVRDLLCHRVGLGTFSGDAIWYKSELPASEIIKQVKHVPQAYSFRGGYGYSNLMFITAGEVIRTVTGKSWDAYVKERFFGPLQMSRTITSTNDLDKKGNYAIPHKTKQDINTPIKWVNWDNMSAAGAIISSADDMANWMIMHLNNGVFEGNALLEAEQQNKLWTVQNPFGFTIEDKKEIPGRHFAGYGLGFGLQDYFGRMMVSHGGGYDGMYSRVVMMPDEQLGIVVLTNSMSGITRPLTYAIVNEFIKEDKRDWIVSSYEPQQPDERVTNLKRARMKGTQPTLTARKYAGQYFAKMYGDISVKIEGGRLRLYFSHSPDLSATLKHWHNNTWEIVWDETHAWFDFGLATFELNDQLDVSGIKLNVPNGDIFFDEYTIVRK